MRKALKATWWGSTNGKTQPWRLRTVPGIRCLSFYEEATWRSTKTRRQQNRPQTSDLRAKRRFSCMGPLLPSLATTKRRNTCSDWSRSSYNCSAKWCELKRAFQIGEWWRLFVPSAERRWNEHLDLAHQRSRWHHCVWSFALSNSTSFRSEGRSEAAQLFYS